MLQRAASVPVTPALVIKCWHVWHGSRSRWNEETLCAHSLWLLTDLTSAATQVHDFGTVLYSLWRPRTNNHALWQDL